MKFTQENKQIFKLFANICQNVYFTSNNISVTDAHRILGCYYEWGGQVTEDFGIQDISKFLSIIDMYNDPEIKKENKNIYIIEGKRKNKLSCLSLESVQTTKPIHTKQDFIDKVISKQTLKTEFILTKEQFNDIKKNLSILDNDHIKFENNTIQTLIHKPNSKTDSENQFVMELDGVSGIKTKIINGKWLNAIMVDNYKIKIFGSFLWLESQTYNLQYMIKYIAI